MSVKSIIYVKKNATCSWKNGKYLANIMNDSVITCDEIIDADVEASTTKLKLTPKNFNENRYPVTCTFISYYSIIIDVSDYCDLIKYQVKKPLVTISRRVMDR